MSDSKGVVRSACLGCLFVVVGGLAGFLIGGWRGEMAARGYQVSDSDHYVCGFFVLSYMLEGVLWALSPERLSVSSSIG